MALLVVGFYIDYVWCRDNSLQMRTIVVFSPLLLPATLAYLLPADDKIPLCLKGCYPLFSEPSCSDDE